MSDLAVGFGLLGALAVGLFVVGIRIGRTLPMRAVALVGLASAAGLFAYHFLLSDNILVAEWLPRSNLIVLGNLTPLLTSLIAGLAWAALPRESAARASRNPEGDEPVSAVHGRVGTLIRRCVVVVLLQLVGWIAVVRPIWGSAPQCGDRWDGDFCLQTTGATCTPACAVTLLRAHGIEATEQEMAELCLTRRGTLWQGLYRGLKLKTAGTPWEVQVVHGSFESLRSLEHRPAILAAGVPRNVQVQRIYTERYGWTPGELHSVLFFGFRGRGLVAMGDPSPGIGREYWSEDDLRVLWRGRGMCLVPRYGSTPRPASASVSR
jgi:hypothetical protein